MKQSKKGFTLVELLVVLVIIGILAAVATPLYLANTQRARASEAVATMSLIRQALRDYRVNNNTYFDVGTFPTGVADGDIQRALPVTPANCPATGGPGGARCGLEVDAGVAKYFSNRSYSVDFNPTDTDGRSNLFQNPPIVDFVIQVSGAASEACDATDDNCATNEADVATYELEMDNSGRIFVCFNTCGTATNWRAY